VICGFATPHRMRLRETSTVGVSGVEAVSLLISSIISHRDFLKVIKTRVSGNPKKVKGATAATARPSDLLNNQIHTSRSELWLL